MVNQSKEKKRDRTHRHILDCAQNLFEKYGVTQVTINDIAEEAGVSRSTFFFHFESLDDLISQVIKRGVDKLNAPDKDGNYPEITEFFHRLNAYMHDYPLMTAELLARTMNSQSRDVFLMANEFVSNNIESDNRLLTFLSVEDSAAAVLGAYMGIVLHRSISGRSLETKELDDVMDGLIGRIKGTK